MASILLESCLGDKSFFQVCRSSLYITLTKSLRDAHFLFKKKCIYSRKYYYITASKTTPSVCIFTYQQLFEWMIGVK